MKFAPRLLVLTLALLPLVAWSQAVDLGPDISPMQRFQVYPHLEKGFEAIARGDRRRAIQEFEQAHKLAPNNAMVALYLADVYRRFEGNVRAVALLTAQLKRNPSHTRLMQALAALQPAPVEARTPASQALPAQSASAALAVAPAHPAPQVAQSTTGAPSAPKTDQVSAATRSLLAVRPAPPMNPARRKGRDGGARPSSTNLAKAPGAPKTIAKGSESAEAVRSREAYQAASRAYSASQRGDHGAAVADARAALQLSPDNIDYRRLLVYSLVESGRYDEADAEATRLETQGNFKADTRWQDLRGTTRSRRAFVHFMQSNRLSDQGDVAGALNQSELGLALAPDALPHRLQLTGLLLRSGQYARAEQVTTEGLRRTDRAGLRALRGFAMQAQGRADEARRDFDAALSADGLSSAEQTSLRLLAVDAALSAHDARRADALLQPLKQSTEPSVLGRRADVDVALRRVVAPGSVWSPGARQPVVRCFGADFAAGCEIWPGQDAVDPAREVAQAAYQAYSERDYAKAAEKAAEAARLNPSLVPYRLLRLQALAADGRVEQAIAEANQYLDAEVKSPEVMATRSRLRHQLGQLELASADAQKALEAGGLSLMSEVDLLLQEGRPAEARSQFARAMEAPALQASADPDLAYLATRVGDDAVGLRVFNRAHEQGRLPVTSLQDGAYVASRLAENDVSVGYFTQAIDAAESGRLKLTPKQLFDTRREVADRTRTWGGNMLLGYRGMSPGTAATSPGLYGDIAQIVGELYWRPQGFRDGSFWEVYGGAAQTLYSKQGGATGGETTQGAVGLRAKPFRNHNAVFSIERRIKIGNLSENDWLLRAGYSNGFGTALRVDAAQWNTMTFFGEVGRFVHHNRNYATAELQAGRSFRMGDPQSRWVLFPHAVLGGDYNSRPTAAGRNGAVGAGVGLGARYWFREDKYNGPRSYIDLSVQHRWRLTGDERGKGWFLRASMAY